jgi:C-terminal processing protease CtpA/Prc
MNILTKVASYLINNNGQGNTLVALAKYKNGSTAKYSFNNNNYVPLDKLTVIANEYSASATECLIGALLTYGDLDINNLIVTSQSSPTGQNTTYGKGIMQTTFYGPKNNAIKLTTAYIYWPDGTTNIHGKGIKANLEYSVLYEDGYARALAVSNG